MTDPQWTEPQRELMGIIYGGRGLWDPPCQHPGPVWVVDADGTGRCTMCPARWTISNENERAARIAAGPPEGESDRDRMWRGFREATWRSRPLILPLPPERGRPLITQTDPLATVIAFLRFRLAEDEAAIKTANKVWFVDGEPIRPLREIQVWRRLIGEYQIPPGTDAVYGGTERETGFRLALSFALKAKALTYDDHPDFRHVETDIAAPAPGPHERGTAGQ